MSRVRLDLNNPEFQNHWFSLEKEEALAVLASLRKISRLDWEAIYQDRGFRWESIHSRTGPNGQRLYSIRLTQRMRAVAFREADFLRMLSLHSDHDSAYK